MRQVSWRLGIPLASAASPLPGMGKETEKIRLTSWSGAPPVQLPPGRFESLPCLSSSLGLKCEGGGRRAGAKGWPEVSPGHEACPLTPPCSALSAQGAQPNGLVVPLPASSDS